LLFSFVEMGSLSRALWEDVAVAACADIIERLQHGEAFTSETSFREQCFHACRTLREEHTPRAPPEVIGRVFGVERGAIVQSLGRVQGSTQWNRTCWMSANSLFAGT
jgi:hypothetical protein